MEIDHRKIKVNGFSAEVPEKLDRDLRTFVTIETDIYAVSTQDNQDGTFTEVFKSKLVGSTIVKQEGQKDAYVCKSKRSKSQQLRMALMSINPDEEFYENTMNQIIMNIDDVVHFLENL